MASTSKIILCTGANQGLGKAVLQAAGKLYEQNTYVLCSRNLENGNKTAKELEASGITAKIDVVQLDVTNDNDIFHAVDYVQKTYGKLDVLINNAGIIRIPKGELATQRAAYTEVLNTNLTSVALVTDSFIPLLHKSSDPRVISVSSGLGSIEGALTKKMFRAPCYGSSKIGMNGAMVHMQVAENDRVAAKDPGDKRSLIRFFCCAPGPLSTSFTRFSPRARPVETGTEVLVRLLADDFKAEGGTFWEFEEGEMRQVPW